VCHQQPPPGLHIDSRMTCVIMEVVSTEENCKAPASLHPQHIIWNKTLIEWWSTFVFLFEGNFSIESPKVVLPPFRIIGCFGFSRYITFVMHLDIHLCLDT
jgi:hypothetical protein